MPYGLETTFTPVEGCVLCPGNNLLLAEPIDDEPELDGFVIPATKMAYGEIITIPETYLVVPKFHAETFEDYPDDWTRSWKRLLAKVPMEIDNVSTNFTRPGGQTVSHDHHWGVGGRGRRSEMPATAGLGLATIIERSRASVGPEVYFGT